MAPARPPIPGQMDLLDWQAPEPVARFDERVVRAATLRGRIALAVAATLRDAAAAGQSRQAIADAMSVHLGERITTATLNSYASQAREDHAIPLTRFVALIHATGDRRLLELLAEPAGWAVVERRVLPLIELAALAEHEDEVKRRRAALRKAALKGGAL